MRLVLGYSGSVETMAAIPWLKDRFGAEIVAVTLDLGQRRELVEIRERALALGATRCHVVDAREDLARQQMLPALKAGVLVGQCRQMAAALEQPLVARKLLEIARMERADAIAHAHGADSIDRARFERAVRVLDPSAVVIRAFDDPALSGGALLEYARLHGIAPPSDEDRGVHENLWGRSMVSAPLDGSSSEAAEGRFTLTRSAAECPDQAAYIVIDFDAGVPVRANGIEMSLVEMIESLETIAGAHGVGRIEGIVERPDGSMSRELSEAPAAAVLHAAARELQSLVIPRELEPVAAGVSCAYADLLDSGLWSAPLREPLDAFVGAIAPRVTGSVRLELVRGECRAVESQSPFAAGDGSSGVDPFSPAAQLGAAGER